MRRFGLGYAPDSYDGLYRYLKGKGFGDEELRSSGLIRFSEGTDENGFLPLGPLP